RAAAKASEWVRPRWPRTLPNGTPSATPTTSASGTTAHAAPRTQTRTGQPDREHAVPSAAAATAWANTDATQSGHHAVAAVAEIGVEREGGVEAEAVHQLEARAIREAEPLVGEAGHHLERAPYHVGLDEQQLVAAAVEEATGDRDGPLGAGAGP